MTKTSAPKKPSSPARKQPESNGAPRRTPSTSALRLRRTEMLLDISHKMAALDTLDEVLLALVDIVTHETKAERGSLFLNDPSSGELYSRVAQGEDIREIRMLNDTGIAGWVFTSGEGRIVHDPYADPHFNRTIDEQTGFRTRNILCAPITTVRGEVIGVVQALNKQKGRFTKDDMALLEAMTTQACIALQNTQTIERMEKKRVQELEFLDIVADVTGEINLNALLQKVMGEATRMLGAERSTLFLNDDKTQELWSSVGEGLDQVQIRLPNHLGIAGSVYTSGQTVNIPHAYADLRFNPSFDKKTGFFTRSILCVPVVNKAGRVIGVTQCLNKRGGPFTGEDEQRLKAFTAQVSIGLENAKLFSDVQNMKNYNESMLQSMSNGVVTLDEDGRIVTCNAAGVAIFKAEDSAAIISKPADEFFSAPNDWVIEKIHKVDKTQISDITVDGELTFGGEKISVNLTVLPLISTDKNKLGAMIMIEDISAEKRMKSTMSRYMDPGVADQLLGQGENLLGGTATTATVLFSDIRSFTTITEELGAQGTVQLLNEYFTIMVDCISHEGGMLDKFIGDAIMAAFGIPIAHGDDEDRAVRAAIAMIVKLHEWNEVRIARGQRPIDHGIGLNTDTVVSGSIGSPKRMDYTIIGDGVNLAARLESACKQYSANLLISEFTFARLKGTYRIRDIDDVVVKGKTKPVRVYEVLDHHSEDTFPNAMELINHFKEGRTQYHKGNWDKAVKSFEQCLTINPRDGLSQTYIERCRHLKKDAPKDWRGIWVMSSK
ncbi:GAF domain-containing protein [Varunaivibrio sulfuroxidans]|uniref:Adenylate cyclase n=1 Tax=Varunaivibrio sulfuroxidans TaxID=1773489 RepID=A0A4R3J8T1_9PROT|nr:GAF domain-containing protein [Varunaivibrio sulfuroxidans]TCS61346.1 adenylate cyclase [Varunaivibrio sulfuroxidans]WES31041.1 GAF domain-containing protein [Varunaivibrio sulfuroxidans]